MQNDNKEEEEEDYSDHLLILQHGLHGSHHDFDYMKLQMQKRYKGLVVHNAVSNSTFLKTQDGIENAGNRLTNEILGLAEKQPKLTKISLIGHSLGGIIARYSVGKLYEAKLFDKLIPVVFMTIATPNVGSRRAVRGTFNKLISVFTSNFLQRTGTELMLEDNTLEGVPLLVLLARKGTIFMAGLAKFNRRILYSNVISDVSVPYCTAAILHRNPYKNGREIVLSKQYPHIVEYEEKEETTIEVNKEDLKDIKEELMGSGEPADEKKEQENNEMIWKYSNDSLEPPEFTDDNNNNNDVGDGNDDKSSNSNNGDKSSNSINDTIVTSSNIPTTVASSENIGVDNKNAGISKEVVVEKLFEKDAKGNHLVEILQSLQSLEWKRYDVYFDTWFLAHTHVVVKRQWINTAGSDVVRHIVDKLFVS